MKTKATENGNILFFILIGVALFGALSFAVTQGSGTSQGTVDQERAELLAGEILDYATSLKTAVQRMKFSGVDEDEYCFDIDQYPGGNTNYEYAACADTRNRVFHPNGGGVQYKEIDSQGLDNSFSAQSYYGEYVISGRSKGKDDSTDHIGTSLADLILNIPYLTRSVCLAINKKMGIPTVSGDAPEEGSALTAVYFDGTYNDAGNAFHDGLYKNTGCQKATSGSYMSSGAYNFYSFLIVR